MIYHLGKGSSLKLLMDLEIQYKCYQNLEINQVKNWKNLPRQMELHVLSFYNENQTFQVTSNITQNHTRN